MTHQQPPAPAYDAIVVGARCAGAATAMLLARAGLKALAIDRQAYGSDTLSTHALMRGGMIQLARWGLLDEVMATRTPAIRRTTFAYGAETVVIDIRPDHGIDALAAPRRTVLDRILVDAARRAGADVRHGAVLLGLETGVDGRVTGATIRDGSGDHAVRAPIVIGADGRHSPVASRVGAPAYRMSLHRAPVIYGYYSGLADGAYRWCYGPGVGIGAIPTNDGLACVFASVPPARFRREMADGAEILFERILAETSPVLAAEVASGARHGGLRGSPGEPGYFRKCFGPGWALVGDAGYFKDPATAHGITDALRDAELLAAAVVDGGQRALSRYQEERDGLSIDLFEATDSVASFEWTLDELQEHHKRLNKAMKAEAAAIASFGHPVTMAA